MGTGCADGLDGELIDFGSVGWRSLGESAADADITSASKASRVVTAARLAWLFLCMDHLLRSLLGVSLRSMQKLLRSCFMLRYAR